MKKIFFLFIFLKFNPLFSQSNTWKMYSDPMGDQKYAYCDNEGGEVIGKLFYKKEDNVWTYVFEYVTGLPQWGRKDPTSYEDITMKFKVGNELIDLEAYLKKKYPKYSNGFELKIWKNKGYFMMVGYDSGYQFTAVRSDSASGDNLNINATITELIKRSSKVSIDYGNKRYYYSTNGFSKIIVQCN